MVMQLQMVFQIIFLLFSIDAIFVQAADLASNSSPCQRSCGNVSDIPFPLGIGAGCYHDPWFEVVCNNNDSWASPRPVLRSVGLELANSPFLFSQSRNIFVAVGCNNFATMTSSDGLVTGCMRRSVCDPSKVIINNTCCNSINCCQTTIASYLDAFNTTIEPINTKAPIIDGCKFAFLVQAEWFDIAFPFSNMSTYAPVVLEWGIPQTSVNSLPIANYSPTCYLEYYCYDLSISASNPNNSTVSCHCRDGFEGNPHLPEGCKDIDECLDPSLNTCLNGSKSCNCVNTRGSFVCYSKKPRVMLMIGEKAISSTRMQEPRSLATYFIDSMEENNLFDILDSQVLKEGKKEEIVVVVNLVKRCLNLNGKK
ncbi:hypothetical protein FH972_010239 [Carpinus fangiana]|uniref:Wall-associated receptor kinase domain-containing protein n=1 Tax=Carpinus fangiana TaxID=176857 RepID=A0A660KQF9_9ROSI|nr:hypothetical protein FH972_010239 [Carpinus fangiana]